MNTVILIPAYNPDEKLFHIVKGLWEKSLKKIIIVNDGSNMKYKSVFENIIKKYNVKILEHAINMGKGAALKTGLNYIYCKYKDINGIITVDADGQHLLKDVCRIAESQKEQKNKIFLGARTLNKKIPFRSRFGNLITKHIFRFFSGLKLKDTQTGLRGLPLSLIPKLLTIKSNRYDFELEMLFLIKREGLQITEIDIETVYIEDNVSSHFNPLFDSLRVYFVFFRFILSSATTAIIDYFIFFTFFNLLNDLLASNYIARSIALFVNFGLNKKLVFHSKGNLIISFTKFIFLVGFMGFMSYLLMLFFINFLNIKVFYAKILAELLLYFPNFLIQRESIFINNEK